MHKVIEAVPLSDVSDRRVKATEQAISEMTQNFGHHAGLRRWTEGQTGRPVSLS